MQKHKIELVFILVISTVSTAIALVYEHATISVSCSDLWIFVLFIAAIIGLFLVKKYVEFTV